MIAEVEDGTNAGQRLRSIDSGPAATRRTAGKRNKGRGRPLAFHVGAWAYRVRFCRSVKDWDGRKVAGFADWRNHRISIDVTSPKCIWRELLRHEVHHIWQFHVPRPRTEEEEAILGSLVADSFAAELAAQGGWARFTRLAEAALGRAAATSK